MAVTDSELDLYADVSAEIALGRPREEVLGARAMDDAAFEALEAAVEAETSRAMDELGDAVPKFLVRLDRSMARARAEADRAGTPISFEAFTTAIAAIASGRDPKAELARLGLDGRDLGRALAAYSGELAKNPGRAAELTRALAAVKKAAPGTGDGSG